VRKKRREGQTKKRGEKKGETLPLLLFFSLRATHVKLYLSIRIHTPIAWN